MYGLGVEWLNYHHLRYFWAVVREGGVTRASEKLHISQPTVSAQLRELEQALGEKLLERSGRGLRVTEMGRVVYRYADEIFGLGRELLDAVKGRPTGRPARLVVGLANAVPKLIAYRLLEPAFRLPEAVVVECREDRPERLLAELALHSLDVVLSDAPLGSDVDVRAYSHLLGETSVSFFGAVKAPAGRRFPASLDGAAMLLPTRNTALRRSLDQWFEQHGVRPAVVGEFEDSALLKVFGQVGRGVFPAPTAIEAEVRRQYGVRRLGELPEVKERFYAISVERRLKHPAVLAICEAARQKLFA